MSHALLERADGEVTDTEVIFRRSNLSDPILDRYSDLLLRHMELKVALDHLDDLADGILYLDGSLYAELPHLLYPLRVQTAVDLPLRILEMYLELWQRSRELNLMVVGIAKTSRGSLLSNTFLNLPADSDTVPVDVDDDEMRLGGENLPTDAEILYRWTEGAGFTTPILVGMQSFGHRKRQLLGAQSALIREYERHGVDVDRTNDILERVLDEAAIAAWYVRFNAGEDPLRVEVPMTVLSDETSAISDFYSRILSSESARQVLGYLSASHGGLSVYNAPLYTADRKVRLRRRVVDTKYLSIVRHVVDKPVDYDRSLRRFMRR